MNKAKVDVGQSPPLDLVSAQAEVAVEPGTADHRRDGGQAGRRSPARADLRCRPSATSGTSQIETVDSPPVGTAALDVDARDHRALRDRADLVARAQGQSRTRRRTSKLHRQPAPARRPRRTPATRRAASAAPQVLRTGGFPGTIVGPGNVTGFGSVLDQLFGSDYPTWAVGVSVSLSARPERPTRPTTRGARLERAQAEQRRRARKRASIQQVRDAAWKVEMNAKRIETTRAARELAEQRLDAEQKRFEVGMSTSFLVIQAQRDLAQAETNELSARARLRPVAGRLRGAAAGGPGAVGDGDSVGPGRGRGPDGVGAHRRAACHRGRRRRGIAHREPARLPAAVADGPG